MDLENYDELKVTKKAIVIVRSNPESHDKSRIEKYIQDNDIEVLGEDSGKMRKFFYDYRSGDSNWAFERYEDRLAFLKGVERKMDMILVESNFFTEIGQTDLFEQRLVQEVIRKIGFELVCIDGDSLFSESVVIERDPEELFNIVKRYEKLRLTLSRIRTKQKNEEKGVVNLQGKGKISGRKSYLERDRDLVKKVRQLKMNRYANSEISRILFDLGYKTKTGKEFERGMIIRLYKQSDKLTDEEKLEIEKNLGVGTQTMTDEIK